jgi:hypothetical protein
MSDEEPRDAAEQEDAVAPAAEGEEPEDWSPFSELAEEFRPEPIPRVMGLDGLPTVALTENKSDIPALSTETLVCMGDISAFVIRNAFGDPVATFETKEVERAPDGGYRARRTLVEERMKFEVERVRKNVVGQSSVAAQMMCEHGTDLTKLSDREILSMTLGMWAQARRREIRIGADWIEVEPLRPACVFYGRQFSQADFNPEIRVMNRVCTARRDTAGAFMSLRDRAMWACDLRQPRDPVSDQKLDEFDEKKMREGTNRTFLPIFGGGIFEGKES